MGQVVRIFMCAGVLALIASCSTPSKFTKSRAQDENLRQAAEVEFWEPQLESAAHEFEEGDGYLNVDSHYEEGATDEFDLFFEQGQRGYVADQNGLALDVCREGDIDCVCPEIAHEMNVDDGRDEPEYDFLDGYEGRKKPKAKPSRTDTFVRVMVDAPHAVVMVDGLMVAEAGEYFAVDPGRIRLEVWAEGHQVVVRKLQVKAHQKRDVRVRLD